MGLTVVVTCYCDADHAGCRVTQRPQLEIILYVYNAPITWNSKRQNSVRSSTFGYEFIAMCIAVEHSNKSCGLLEFPLRARLTFSATTNQFSRTVHTMSLSSRRSIMLSPITGYAKHKLLRLSGMCGRADKKILPTFSPSFCQNPDIGNSQGNFCIKASEDKLWFHFFLSRGFFVFYVSIFIQHSSNLVPAIVTNLFITGSSTRGLNYSRLPKSPGYCSHQIRPKSDSDKGT
jgi:hypothetical protein